MNCPNCAAALELLPGRTHLRCPYCTSLVFPETVEEGVVALEKNHRLDCPACDRSLVQAGLDGCSVAYCSGCRGILLTTEQLAQVVTRRRAMRTAGSHVAEPIDANELRRKIRCPDCGQRMDAHPYGGGGNAIIDSCVRCHLVWLDAGELTLLSQFAPERRAIWDAESAVNFEPLLRSSLD